MHHLSDMFQTADWKTEKHVPVIEAPRKFRKGEMTPVTVTIGKEIAHPNTTEHHIAWMDLYFHPRDEKYPYHVARFEFLSHGASVNGPNTSSVCTHHEGTCKFKTDKPGILHASSYCNIHGLWQNSMEIEVEEMGQERMEEPAMSGRQKGY